MCVRTRTCRCLIPCAGKPIQLIGDDKWHKYTIDWHAGNMLNGNNEPGYVDFYVDDMYLVRIRAAGAGGRVLLCGCIGVCVCVCSWGCVLD